MTAILEVGPGRVLIGAQSHLWNASAGGIWVGTGDGHTGGAGWSWAPSLDLPTFNLVSLPTNEGVPGGVFATHARLPDRSASISLVRGLA